MRNSGLVCNPLTQEKVCGPPGDHQAGRWGVGGAPCGLERTVHCSRVACWPLPSSPWPPPPQPHPWLCTTTASRRPSPRRSFLSLDCPHLDAKIIVVKLLLDLVTPCLNPVTSRSWSSLLGSLHARLCLLLRPVSPCPLPVLGAPGAAHPFRRPPTGYPAATLNIFYWCFLKTKSYFCVWPVTGTWDTFVRKGHWIQWLRASDSGAMRLNPTPDASWLCDSASFLTFVPQFFWVWNESNNIVQCYWEGWVNIDIKHLKQRLANTCYKSYINICYYDCA